MPDQGFLVAWFIDQTVKTPLHSNHKDIRRQYQSTKLQTWIAVCFYIIGNYNFCLKTLYFLLVLEKLSVTYFLYCVPSEMCGFHLLCTHFSFNWKSLENKTGKDKLQGRHKWVWFYRDHLNTRLVRNSNGRFVFGCLMVRYSNGGLIKPYLNQRKAWL